MKCFIRITLLTILLPTMSFGGDKLKHEEHENTSGVEGLSHDLRSLLSTEMLALQSGMMSIIPAYVAGNWGEIEMTAEKIVEELYLTIYSRYPDTQEQEIGRLLFNQDKITRQQATEDLMWALLNTSEFILRD